MATIIKIKRSTGSSAPSGLEQGELAYVYDTSSASTGAGGNGLRLFIGDHTSTSNAAIEIGGQYYKLLLGRLLKLQLYLLRVPDKIQKIKLV